MSESKSSQSNNSYRSASPVERELLLALAGQDGEVLEDNTLESRVLTSPPNTPQPQLPDAATTALVFNNTAFRTTAFIFKTVCFMRLIKNPVNTYEK